MEDKLMQSVIRLEWEQFQRTDNEGGRAACQGDWPTFLQMRSSQFLTWPQQLLESYRDDLDAAEHSDRNLVTEKYARMMASTAPEKYARDIEPFIPRLSEQRLAAQEEVIMQQVRWANAFRMHYPRLGSKMRALTTQEDTARSTSFETYLRGELGTYGDRTFLLYRRFVLRMASAERNLTEETVLNTVRIEGYASLAEAEASQR
ncbi:DUF4125 family protein [Bifidobacterium bombi]|uniref:DUF4125 domain-containing protein n=1 Tax=Bifidobacterium bombi DSM 19703 TaxID=1341695 RepID=A0A086BP47_9BIFI|nr:DUF4125 family protein [Bifidobacterium bombi]KFF30711.1 hypothetical protein BBOMB_0016 [Bifidobacterium bombi DSM 19703]